MHSPDAERCSLDEKRGNTRRRNQGSWQTSKAGAGGQCKLGCPASVRRPVWLLRSGELGNLCHTKRLAFRVVALSRCSIRAGESRLCYDCRVPANWTSREMSSTCTQDRGPAGATHTPDGAWPAPAASSWPPGHLGQASPSSGPGWRDWLWTRLILWDGMGKAATFPLPAAPPPVDLEVVCDLHMICMNIHADFIKTLAPGI